MVWFDMLVLTMVEILAAKTGVLTVNKGFDNLRILYYLSGFTSL